MLTDEERKEEPIPIGAIRQEARRCGAHDFMTFSHIKQGGILHEKQCNLLSDFLDYLWAETQGESSIDMKVVIAGKEMIALLDHLTNCNGMKHPNEVFEQLNAQHGKISTTSSRSRAKIALRMTKANNNCIDFHCDHHPATGTTQIPLNPCNEYSGGSLVFFVNNSLHFVPREVGSIVQHPSLVLHGVTRVASGTRKSLFVLDECNGLGEEGFITVISADVDSFLSGLLN